MGNLHAQELASMVGHEVELRTALSWHLTSNHFPPVPDIMVEPCIEAIENAEIGDWDREISLPEGVGYKGLTVAPTWAMVEQHHLDSFINYDED
jgi:hypothetical protein